MLVIKYHCCYLCSILKVFYIIFLWLVWKHITNWGQLFWWKKSIRKRSYDEEKKEKGCYAPGVNLLAKLQCLGFNSPLFKHKYMNIMWTEIIIKNQETFQSRKTFFVTNKFEQLVDGLNDSTELFLKSPQCPRTDLNKRFLPKPMTITGWKGTP